MTKTTKIITAVIAIIIAIIIIWLAIFNDPPTEPPNNLPDADTNDLTPAANSSENAPQTNSPATSLKTYANTAHNFSFSYPTELNARELDIEDADVIVVEGKDSTKGFQIVITPFDKDALALADIAEHMGGVKVENVRDMSIDKGAVKGFLFASGNPSFEGESIEAWFVKDGALYQASSYLKNESLVLQALDGWRFRD